MRAAGAGSSRALRRADSAIFAFGSSARRTAADADLGIAVAKAPLDRLVHGPLGPEGGERPRAHSRRPREPSRSSAANRERTFAAGSSFGSMPATGPSRPMKRKRGRLGLRAGLGRQLVDQGQRGGIALAGADLEREFFHHRGRPGADRAIGIAQPPRDRLGPAPPTGRRES